MICWSEGSDHLVAIDRISEANQAERKRFPSTERLGTIETRETRHSFWTSKRNPADSSLNIHRYHCRPPLSTHLRTKKRRKKNTKVMRRVMKISNPRSNENPAIRITSIPKVRVQQIAEMHYCACRIEEKATSFGRCRRRGRRRSIEKINRTEASSSSVGQTRRRSGHFARYQVDVCCQQNAYGASARTGTLFLTIPTQWHAVPLV